MATLTLRPDGAGNYTNIASQNPGSGAHWEKVDEATPDDADYVYTSAGTIERDSYTLGNTAQSGTVNSATVHFRTESTFDDGKVMPFLRLSSTNNDGTEVAMPTTPATQSETIGRPGGGAWSWTDINALEVGAGIYSPGTSGARMSQIYVVVDYTATGGRTTKNSRAAANVHPGVLLQTISGGHGY